MTTIPIVSVIVKLNISKNKELPAMFRLTVCAFLTLVSLVSLSCQSYSTGLQKSVVVTDETAATGVLRTVALAQQSYSAMNNGKFGTFQELSANGFLDSRFNSDKPTIKDYSFAMDVGQDASGPFYKCTADPTNTGTQGGRHFYIDSSSAKVHVNATQTASVTDPELGS
jgi:hypothetical protein